MQYYNCDDNKATGNRNSTENEVEIKEEIDSKNLSLLTTIIKNEENDVWINNDYKDSDSIHYENFKLKNEEIDLKLEYHNYDDPEQLTHRYDRVEINKKNSSSDPYISESKEEKPAVNYLIINNLKEVKKYNCLECKVDGITNEIKKCEMCCSEETLGSNKLTQHLKKNSIENDHYLLKMHSADSKILKCNSKNEITRKEFETQPILNCGVKNNSQIFQCLLCTYETPYKHNLISHVKIHRSIEDFKCTYCPKGYTDERQLNNHLLKVHNYRNVMKKSYTCDQCNYETYNQNYYSKHVKLHLNIKNFKCSDCSKEYTTKTSLENHLLKVHQCRDVTKKLHKCDQCNYESYHKSLLMHHMKIHKNIKNFQCPYCPKRYGIEINLNDHLLKIHNCRNLMEKLYNCHQCSYETYYECYFIQHAKFHENKNNKNFKCSSCSKIFTSKRILDNHLLRIHKRRDVIGKIYNCEHCDYETIMKTELMRHKLKHGITQGCTIFKCSQCTFKTYYKTALGIHLKNHNL